MVNAVRFCKALLRTTMIDEQSQTFQIKLFYYHFSAIVLECNFNALGIVTMKLE
jgi:hypothetical protein